METVSVIQREYSAGGHCLRHKSHVAVYLFLVSFISITARTQDKAAIQAAERGCGPENEHLTTHLTLSDGKLEIPPAGKALVYIVDPSPKLWGGAFTFSIGVDGHWVGVLRSRSQFSLILDPGEHHFCVRMGRGNLSRRGNFKQGDPIAIYNTKLGADQTTYLVAALQIESLGEDAVLSIARMWETNSDEGRLLVASSAKSSMVKSK